MEEKRESILTDLIIRQTDNKEYWEVPVGTDTRYGPHGYFRYIGKFPPQIARQLIDQYSSSSDTILDPMCGGGTVLTEAVIARRKKVIGYDVNVVALTVCEAVTTLFDTDRLRVRGETLLSSLYELIGDNSELFHSTPNKNTKLVDLFGNEKYFTTKAHLELSALLHLINRISNTKERAFFLTCFFGILRRTSRCNVKKMNIELDENKKRIWPVASLFAKDVARNVRLNEDFHRMTPPKTPAVILRQRDARTFDRTDKRVGLVVIHPPYMSNTAFSESTQLQLAFMGINHKQVWKRELRHRGSYLHEPNGVRKYLVGWSNIIEQAAKCLRKGGYVAVVIGDGQVDKVRIPMAPITEEFFTDAGLTVVQKAEHVLNNNTGRTLNRRMRTQHIVVAKKR